MGTPEQERIDPSRQDGLEEPFCQGDRLVAFGLTALDEFDVPLVGVIDPGLRALLSVTRTGRVGVIGTVGTIESGAYQGALKR
ncbi:MAG TPA: hypothetical protein VMS00_06550, partial [Acidimicrobiales bacterium]|nr:hypothetical protein [Acidimicrobiales bacterium]